MPGANLSAGIREMGSTGNPSSGFYGGGSPGDRTQVDKLSYSSETTARVPAADLSVARYQLAATSGRENALPSAPSSPATRFTDGNGPSVNAGYFGGGNSWSKINSR